MRVFLHDIAWLQDRDGFLKEQNATAYRCPKRAAFGHFTRRAEDSTPYLETPK